MGHRWMMEGEGTEEVSRPPWLGIARGMIGMGLVFAVCNSAVFAFLDVARWTLLGAEVDLRYLMVETILTGTVPVGFTMGVAFSATLAMAGHRRPFHRISPWRFVTLAAAAGLFAYVAFGLLGSPSSALDDLVNGAFFALVGSGSAFVVLMAARRRRPGPSAGGEKAAP